MTTSHAHPDLSTEEQAIVEAYHKLYYAKRLWHKTPWMGTHCLKSPHDLWIYQEILYDTQPTLVIETGTAWGGSAHFLATLFDAIENLPTRERDPQAGRSAGPPARILTIDTVTRDELEHPRVTKIKASSLDEETVRQVQDRISPDDRVMLILDSLHNRDHVLAELERYAPMVTPGCFAIVEDTNINGHPVHTDFDPDSGPGAFEAVMDYIKTTDRFEIDRSREKLYMTLNPCGYLRCVKA